MYTTNPDNAILHWDLINTPFRQNLVLQCLRSILFNINMEFNTHPDIDKIKNADKSTQCSQLSILANTICKRRKTLFGQRDSFWVTNRKQWGFCGEIITKARKLHTAIGTMNKKSFKYACGRRLLNRTNWNISTFELVGDVDKLKQKRVCTKINNIKRAYELQVSEQLIIAHFESIIDVYTQTNTRLCQRSDTIMKFSKTLLEPTCRF